MKKHTGRLTIGKKMYLFISLIVLTAVIGTAAISYNISAGQIDRFYKSTTLSTAESFASMLDSDFLAALREEFSTDAYQQVLSQAEEENDDIIRDYLETVGLWEGYAQTSDFLNRYLDSNETVKYLYLIVCGDAYAEYSLYVMDDDENPLYLVAGVMTPNEGEFYGMDTSGKIAPTITNGDWGWLCSGYAPVLDADGNVVCHVGCDVSMDDVMKERKQFLWSIVIGALVFTAAVVAVAVLLVNRAVVKPLHLLTSEMKKFQPADNSSYETAGVIQLDIRSNDEIQDIYQEIHTMQTNIIDYLNSLSVLQKDKEQAELDIHERGVQIGKISQEAYRDSLTGVGSKAAYVRKLEELNAVIAEGTAEFAIVMVDMNNLKKINDVHGHKNGDLYIKGCCHLICEIFKHSPVFRIGGDEFAVILQGSDYTHRQDYVEAFRAAYTEAFENAAQEPWQRYSASVGIAEYASDDSTVELVFKRADRAMYEDKEVFRKKYGSYR